MMYIRGSGSGVGDTEWLGFSYDDILELIATKVVVVVRGAILKVFGSIKTIMIELFDERYADVAMRWIFLCVGLFLHLFLSG